MLAVDARWMVGNYRGMGHYARSLVDPVAREITALLPLGSPPSPYLSIFKGNNFFPWWEQITLPRLCAEYGVTRLLCPYNSAPTRLQASTDMLLVVHDLIYMEPWSSLGPSVSAYQTFGRIYRRYIVPRAIKRATHLIAVSEYTRNQLSQQFSIPENDISIIPNSLGEDWYLDKPLSLDCRLPYLLTVTGEAPSKNLGALIRSFSKFRSQLGPQVQDISLRIVGIKLEYQPHFMRLAESLGVGANINFELFLNESRLRELYREAWLFVMPSLYEGFGIPVLEAMASGTPVVCSNTTSLPELVGDAGWLFDPRDLNDMAEKLFYAWTDSNGRSERSLLGMDRAQYYRRTNVEHLISNFWNSL